MRHFLLHREIRYLGWLTPGLFVATSIFVTTRNGFPTAEGERRDFQPKKNLSLSLPPSSLSIFPGFFIFSRSSWHGINVVQKKLTRKWRGTGLFSRYIITRDETTETSRQGLEITRVRGDFSDSGYPRACTKRGNGMLDKLLIDHALVSLCDPVIGNRAVYSRYCQQRGGEGQRGGMSRIWNTIDRNVSAVWWEGRVGIVESNGIEFNFNSNPNFKSKSKNFVAKESAKRNDRERGCDTAARAKRVFLYANKF